MNGLGHQDVCPSPSGGSLIKLQQILVVQTGQNMLKPCQIHLLQHPKRLSVSFGKTWIYSFFCLKTAWLSQAKDWPRLRVTPIPCPSGGRTTVADCNAHSHIGC